MELSKPGQVIRGLRAPHSLLAIVIRLQALTGNEGMNFSRPDIGSATAYIAHHTRHSSHRSNNLVPSVRPSY